MMPALLVTVVVRCDLAVRMYHWGWGRSGDRFVLRGEMIALDSTSKAKNRPAEQEAQHKNRNLLLRAIVMISHLLRRVILSHRPFKPIWDSAQERRRAWLDIFELSSVSSDAKLRASSIVDDSIKKEASFEFWLQVIQGAQAILWFLLFGLGEIMMFLFGLSLGIGGGPEGSLSKLLPYILAFVVYNGSIVLSQWTLGWNRRRVGLFVYLLILAVGLAAYLYLFQELLVTLELQDGPRSSYEWFQYIFLVSLSWGWIVSAWWGLLTLLASIATWLLRTVMRRGGEGIISSMVHVIVRYEILLGNKGEWNRRRLVVSDLQELAREIELSLPRIVGFIDQPSREWVLAKASAMANEVRGGEEIYCWLERRTRTSGYVSKKCLSVLQMTTGASWMLLFRRGCLRARLFGFAPFLSWLYRPVF